MGDEINGGVKKRGADALCLALCLAALAAAATTLGWNVVCARQLRAAGEALQESVVLEITGRDGQTAQGTFAPALAAYTDAQFAAEVKDGALQVVSPGFLLAQPALDGVALCCPADAQIELYDAAAGCLVYRWAGAQITVQQQPAGQVTANAVYLAQERDGGQVLVAQKRLSNSTAVVVLARQMPGQAAPAVREHIIQLYRQVGLCGSFSAEVFGCAVSPAWQCGLTYSDGALSFCADGIRVVFSVYNGELTGAGFVDQVTAGQLTLYGGTIADQATGYRPFMLERQGVTVKVMAPDGDTLQKMFDGPE